MSEPSLTPTPAEIVQRLTAEVRRIEGLHHSLSGEVLTTGCVALDRLLPSAGLRRGTLVEWLAEGAGSGAALLALIAAREACRQGGMLAVLDSQRSFYPPAAVGLHIDLEKLLIVRPPNRRDDSWALDQLLRSRAIAAVMAWPGDWDEHTFRRLQLAVEAGQGLGLLLRPDSIRREPSWAELRLRVEPLPLGTPPLVAPLPTMPDMPLKQRTGSAPTHSVDGEVLRRGATVPLFEQAVQARRRGRRWRLEIARIRGGPAGGSLEVELDEPSGTLYETRTTDPVHLASRLAARAPGRRSRGA
jgi:protein ImuA